MSALTINGVDVAIVQNGFRTRYEPMEELRRARSGKLRRSRRANPRVFAVTTAVMPRDQSESLEAILRAEGPFPCTGDVLRGALIYCYPVGLEVIEENIEDVRFAFELWESTGAANRFMQASAAGKSAAGASGSVV